MRIIEGAFLLSHYLIMAAGVYACLRAYMRRRSRAWILLAIYCFHPFLILGMRTVGQALVEARPRRQEEYREPEFHNETHVMERSVNIQLPIFPVLLVAGLWALHKRETTGEASPIASATGAGGDGAQSSPEQRATPVA